MNSKIIILLCFIVFIGQTQDCMAQQHAKITITKKGSNSPKAHVFSDFPQTMYNCGKVQGDGPQPTEITFLHGDISVFIRIFPSTTGTFTEAGQIPAEVTIRDVLDGLGSDNRETPAYGTNCSITITRYPPVGGYIIGTFNATFKNADDAGNAYLASGEFKVKRTQ